MLYRHRIASNQKTIRNYEKRYSLEITNITADTQHMEQKEVHIYSTPTCHFCQAAKSFFSENNIAYNDYNVAEDAEKRNEMLEKSGQMGVPVIFIGDDMIIGFDEGRVRELLGL